MKYFAFFLILLAGCVPPPKLNHFGTRVRAVSEKERQSCRLITPTQVEDDSYEGALIRLKNKVASLGGNAFFITSSEGVHLIKEIEDDGDVRTSSSRVISADVLSCQGAAATEPTSVQPSQLKAKLLDLMKEGLGEEVLISYARQSRLPAKLSADEIIDWKKSGIPESVISAVMNAAPQ